MARVQAFFKYWLPVLLWMALIFTASSDTHSYQHSSRLLAPLLHWLFPHLSENALDWSVLIARKCAHLTVYAVLALLLWRALRRPLKDDPRPWNWSEAGRALLLLALYAASDEFHQSFVPTRTAHVTDVLLDTAGGTVSLILLSLIAFRRQPSLPAEK